MLKDVHTLQFYGTFRHGFFDNHSKNLLPFFAGILDPDEKGDEDDDDEILSELRRKQNELRVLSQHNLMLTKRLYKMAKDEMSRQDLRRKMIAADAEVKIFQSFFVFAIIFSVVLSVFWIFQNIAMIAR